MSDYFSRRKATINYWLPLCTAYRRFTLATDMAKQSWKDSFEEFTHVSVLSCIARITCGNLRLSLPLVIDSLAFVCRARLAHQIKVYLVHSYLSRDYILSLILCTCERRLRMFV
jgi:hypothetical protein